jgi:hypothetical protein
MSEPKLVTDVKGKLFRTYEFGVFIGAMMVNLHCYLFTSKSCPPYPLSPNNSHAGPMKFNK